jgi:hypothetical protein
MPSGVISRAHDGRAEDTATAAKAVPDLSSPDHRAIADNDRIIVDVRH